VCPGNNSEVVARWMKTRKDWEEIPYYSTLFNFKWQPISRGILFDLLSANGRKQLVNHFKCHPDISTKNGLFDSLKDYWESYLFEYIPMTFVLWPSSSTYKNNMELFKSVFDLLQSSENASNEEINAKLQSLSYSKGKAKKLNPTLFLPATHFWGRNLWFLKCTHYNRGKGIYVFDSFEKLVELMNEIDKGMEEEGSKVKSETFVVQKYVERPLLFEGRKFDVRVWVLVTQKLKVYFFREGYIRTSSSAFSLNPSTLTSPYIHLTNNAIQISSPEYSKFEDGNQLSFSSLEAYLSTFPYFSSSIDEIINDMKKLIILTFLSSRQKFLNSENKNSWFEIFGFDFIIDENGKSWLIEVSFQVILVKH
jgi:hypothetical protein